MRAPLLPVVAVCALGCFELTGADGFTPPSDNPGVRLEAPLLCCNLNWSSAWDVSSGRLIFPVFVGQMQQGAPVFPLSFAVVAFTPTGSTIDTIGRGGGLGFGSMQVAPSGAVYYSYRPSAASDLFAVQRTPPLAASSTPLSLPVPLLERFFVTPDESKIVLQMAYSNTPGPHYASVDLSSSQTLATVANSAGGIIAISPDGDELLAEFPSPRVVTISTGAVRTLNMSVPSPFNAARILRGAWVNGAFRLLVQGTSKAGSIWTRTLYEWDESGGAQPLGSLSSEEGVYSCAAWAPEARTAVFFGDSITNGRLEEAYRAHWKMVVMEDGVATTFGSANMSNWIPMTCSLSPDGKWFSYRYSTGSLYLKEVP